MPGSHPRPINQNLYGGSPGDSNMQLRPRSTGTKILNFSVHIILGGGGEKLGTFPLFQHKFGLVGFECPQYLHFLHEFQIMLMHMVFGAYFKKYYDNVQNS